MTASVQDVLTIDAVLVDFQLLRDEHEINAYGAAIGVEIVPERVLVAGAPQMPPLQGWVLRLPRNRMILETSARRTRIVKEYPSSNDDVTAVVELARKAIDATNLGEDVPSAYGFNIQVVYDQNSGDNAMSYLGQRLFAPTNDLHERWGLVGGFGKLMFQEDQRQWTIALEPRFNDPNTTKVFLDINLHIPEGRLPEEDEMRTLLGELWDRTHALIETIDGRGDA